jgi:hypothetical protein
MASKEIRLEVWLASHIHCKERASSLMYAVRSVNEQTSKPIVYVSVSAGKEFDLGKIKKQINAELKDCEHYVFAHETRKKQFEHLKFIYDTHSEKYKNTWVSFLDDDDIISPDRMEIVCGSIKRYPEFDRFQSAYYELNCFTGCIIMESWKDGIGKINDVGMWREVNPGHDFATLIVKIDVVSHFFESKLVKKCFKQGVSNIFDCFFVDIIRDGGKVGEIEKATYMINRTTDKLWKHDVN